MRSRQVRLSVLFIAIVVVDSFNDSFLLIFRIILVRFLFIVLLIVF